MNSILKIILVIGCFICAIVIISMTTIFIIPITSTSCLESHANNYCAASGYTHHSVSSEQSFYCYKDFNSRTKDHTSKRFYFLNKELSGCRTKDSFTFTKQNMSEVKE